MSPDLPHQARNAAALVDALGRYRAAADFSEMGSGKTRTFLRVIRTLDKPTLLVGPKISATSVARAGAETGTDFSFCNWELVRTGRTPFGWWEKPPVSAARAKKLDVRKQAGRFRWAPEIGLLVFDEAHRAKASDSQQCGLLRAASDQGIPHLLVTATPPADPTELRAIGYSMGLHEWADWWNWCRRNGCYKLPMGGMKFTTKADRRQKVIDKLAAEMAGRVVRTGLREVYPDNPLVVLPELYDLPEAEAFRVLSEEAAFHLRSVSGFLGPGEPEGMAEYQKARQKMELLRIPVLLELAEVGRAAGRTVHIFVNYTETIEELRRHLPDYGVISGEAPFNKQAHRQEVMDAAQWGKIPGCILNTAAGSESISLQDLSGEHPPEGLICVPDSAARFVQVLGRLDRVGGKSVPVARLILAAGSEEAIYDRLMLKRNDMKRLVDGADLRMPA